MKMFKIMLNLHGTRSILRAAYEKGTPYILAFLPWEMIGPHEPQALKNHDQTLARLHDRGGLSACEALAVLEDRPWRPMDDAEANEQLCKAVARWVDGEVAKIEAPTFTATEGNKP